MSSFNADKKREHEASAEKALAAGDYAKAFFHTAQAAEFAFTLAEKSEGDVAKAYLDDANGLVEKLDRAWERSFRMIETKVSTCQHLCQLIN